MNWLRRLIARFDRRWIRDSEERDEHESVVRQRLSGASAEPEGLADTADRSGQ